MARSDIQVNFRVAPELVEWLKEYAKACDRSVTAQLTHIIKQEKNRVTQQQQPNFGQ